MVAGESAGANLAAALAVMACFPREEPFARGVFETGVVPAAVLPACGIHQVTDPQRFRRRKPRMLQVVADRIEEVSHAYVGDRAGDDVALADPLRILEGDAPTSRPLPPFFVTCGTADPLLDDTRRLHAALRRRGAQSEARYYPGELHAFHAMVFRERARQHWRDSYAFLDRVVPHGSRGR